MKIKVSQATSLQLDWLVGTIEKVEGLTYSERTNKLYGYDERKLMSRYSPTTSWAQGGEIIEREKIAVSYDAEWLYVPGNADPDDEPDNGDRWYAEIRKSSHEFVSDYGPTPLVAAMRCFISSRLGDEVEIPEELAC